MKSALVAGGGFFQRPTLSCSHVAPAKRPAIQQLSGLGGWGEEDWRVDRTTAQAGVDWRPQRAANIPDRAGNRSGQPTAPESWRGRTELLRQLSNFTLL